MKKNGQLIAYAKSIPLRTGIKSLFSSFRIDFKKNGSMDRRPGSGRPQTVATADNEKIVEYLICSQEESPGSHMSPREIEKHTGIGRSSVRRMVKRKDIERIMKRRDWMFIQDSAPLASIKSGSKFLNKKLANALSSTMNGPQLPQTVTLLIINFGIK